MSRSGTKSGQGDEYQSRVALHWLIRLLNDEDISFVQAESNGLPRINEDIVVDDIVVVYADGSNPGIGHGRCQICPGNCPKS